MKSQDSYSQRPDVFHDVTPALWNDWHWQQRSRIRTLEQLRNAVSMTPDEVAAFTLAQAKFRVAITPHYLAMMDRDDPACPLRLQAVPQSEELLTYDFELRDPLAEESHMPVPGLTHRYPDRALLYVSHNCPLYCRHCTRKRKVADPATASSTAVIDGAIDYIRENSSIRDVILSGGDPLSLSNARLEGILSKLKQIPHLDVIRLGTRNPVTLPQRIDDELLSILAQHSPIYVHTHFNHPRELSLESQSSLRRMVQAGAVLGNQMVLLKGVNDKPETVLELNRALLRLGCRPYYMLHCDMAEGITHFRTSIRTGLEIVAYLRGRIGGLGIPDFVVDLPGGGGKIELVPEYLMGEKPHPLGRVLEFKNFQGRHFEMVDVYSSGET